MKVIQFPVLSDNYVYLICSDTSPECVVVDSPDAPKTRKTVSENNLELVGILNTHHHWDHAGGNADLIRQNKLPVYGSYYDFNHQRIDGLSNPIKEDDVFKINTLSFKVMDVPGHTLGHVAYVIEDAVFCGDTLFTGGCGRLFEGDPTMMLSSLKKLKSLPDDTKVYCAHEYTQKNLEFALTLEPHNKNLQKKYEEVLIKRKNNKPTVPSTIGEEKSYNPFLRWDNEELIDSINTKTKNNVSKAIDVFSLTRQLKDRF